MINDNSSSNPDSIRQSLLDQAMAAAGRMQILLSNENEALKRRDDIALQALLVEKKYCLSELESLNRQLQSAEAGRAGNRRDETDSFRESKDALQAVLHHCQQLNHDNQEITTVEIRHSRQALDLLRSLMNMNDLVLYGEAGEMSVSREQRYLGKV